MGGPGEHFAKWNKQGSKRQILYDLTYKWNLMNKTNKRAKQNQKHRNKEQTDRDQSGRGQAGKGGTKGKGLVKEQV